MSPSYAQAGGYGALASGLGNLRQMLVSGRQRNEDIERRNRLEAEATERENSALLREETWRAEDLERAGTLRTEDRAQYLSDVGNEREYRAEQAELERGGALSRTLAGRRPITSGNLSGDQLLDALMQENKILNPEGYVSGYKRPVADLVDEVRRMRSGGTQSPSLPPPPPDPFNWGGPVPEYQRGGGPLRPDATGVTPGPAPAVTPSDTTANLSAALTASPETVAAPTVGTVRRGEREYQVERPSLAEVATSASEALGGGLEGISRMLSSLGGAPQEGRTFTHGGREFTTGTPTPTPSVAPATDSTMITQEELALGGDGVRAYIERLIAGGMSPDSVRATAISQGLFPDATRP